MLTIITTIEPEVGGPSFVAVNAVVAERADGRLTDLVSTVPHGGSRRRTDLTDKLAASGARHVTFERPRMGEALSKRWGFSMGAVPWVLWQTRRYDIVHAHYVWSLGTVLAVLAGAIWRKPVLLTPHESLTRFGVETSRSRTRAWQKRVGKNLLLRGISAVVVSSALEERDSDVGHTLTHVIPHPVESLVSSPRLAVDESAISLGFLGRLHEKKRVALLLETVAKLPSTVRLVVGGDQPPSELERLRRLANRIGIADRTAFVGFVDDRHRAAFFAQLDVLVMPSQYECFGMVAAEALCAGLPVVVSDQTGVAATVLAEGVGRTFPAHDPMALLEVLQQLVEDPKQLTIMAARARTAAQRSFSYAAYADRALQLYRRCLDDKATW